MGRYYNTNRFYGKFGFAVQSSSDPEIFGMYEDEPTEITYYADDSAIQQVIDVLNKQYEICEVPEGERIYQVENDKALGEYLEAHVDPRIYREYDSRKDDGIPYGGFSKEFIEKNCFKSETLYPKKHEMALAACRIALGLRILTDLKLDGYCSLVAEL